MEHSQRRVRPSDVAVVVATPVWPGVLWLQTFTGDFTWPDPPLLSFNVLAAVVALGLVLVRRRHPTAAAVAILPLSAAPFAFVPAAVALYTVAAVRERRMAITLAVAYLTVALTAAAIVDPPDAWLPHIATIGAFHAIPVTLGMVRAARNALLREYEERAVRAETEQQLRVDQARRLERQRIAREMHDLVAHRISLVSLHAGALAYRSDTSPAEIAEAAEVIRSSSHDALNELRGVISVLRDHTDNGETTHVERPQPTLADLPALFERCRAAGTTLTVHDGSADLDAVPPAVARTAYRVLEEGLTNAAKHAPQAPVDVTIGTDSNRLLLQVENTMPLTMGAGHHNGSSGIPGAGAGLVGLAERVSLAGGALEHGSTPHGRFRIRTELPCNA